MQEGEVPQYSGAADQTPQPTPPTARTRLGGQQEAGGSHEARVSRTKVADAAAPLVMASGAAAAPPQPRGVEFGKVEGGGGNDTGAHHRLVVGWGGGGGRSLLLLRRRRLDEAGELLDVCRGVGGLRGSHV